MFSGVRQWPGVRAILIQGHTLLLHILSYSCSGFTVSGLVGLVLQKIKGRCLQHHRFREFHTYTSAGSWVAFQGSGVRFYCRCLLASWGSVSNGTGVLRSQSLRLCCQNFSNSATARHISEPWRTGTGALSRQIFFTKARKPGIPTFG